ncbi:MAG TPA: ABC transporter permease [Planctomycetota bacterium]|nr:ABC transporter permease [Planctomycetota bacterium]
MFAYIVRRLLYAIPILIGVNLLTFFLFNFVNDPIGQARKELGKHADNKAVAGWLQRNGYALKDGSPRPYYLNTAEGSNGILTDTVFYDKSVRKMYFDFGKSRRQEDITREIWNRAPASLMVNIPAMIFGILFSLTLAMIVAYMRGSFVDTYGVILCVLAMSISIMFYIIGGQFLFAKLLNLYPISGYEPGMGAAKFVVMPVVVGFFGGLGSSIRFYRTIFLEEMSKDYVRTARAKGLSEVQVLSRHVLRNAMIPLVTQIVVDLPTIFIGSLVLERFFSIPGLGSYVIDGIQANDTNIVYSMTYLGAVLFIIGLILTDIAYTIVDPRIRLN